MMTAEDVPHELSEEERNLLNRGAEMMNGIKYTYKTHYKMGEWYEKFSLIENTIVAVGTAGLIISLIWNAFSREALVTIAIVVAMASWLRAVFSWGKKSQRHFNAADRYHSLFEEFDDYIKIEIHKDDLSEKQKRGMFDSLSEKRKHLNELTPRTTNFWYNRVSEEEAQATADNSEEEVNEIAESAI